ncbi:lytic transglycosylase domain-containing protein [Oligoflexus tunisiensis]|uniref:lytic transglycosylase domain-containing protein n=1 Tax=Oligoflexus tunisiensis TaxID=708132 RepID=UPI000A3E1123|nr:lytic transglycosylase domain-containing protein [Oligoflexus tunisiensis]
MRLATVALLFSLTTWTASGFSQTESETQLIDSDQTFPATPLVKAQSEFWVKIFRRYKSSAIVIHDPEYVDIIIDVVDYDSFKQKYNNGRSFNRNEKRDILNRYVERYQIAITRLQKIGKKALEYGPMEQRVLQVYSKRKETLSRLFTEEIYLRTQQGLSDEFARAAERADSYLPYMERIFRNRNLPHELTRIAFVESMFNREALSKVGASGVWQFMPNTARIYMTVNSYIDERLSPLKASYGAAMLLEQNHKRLKIWPLAITAYNHGAGGMQRAVRTVGSSNLDDIIRRYKAGSFGFASRNFYSEFLAARQVYKDLYEEQANTHKNPLKIDHIRLERPVSVHQLITQTPLKKEILQEYNQCILPKAFANKHRPLPTGFEIIVPQELSAQVRRSLKQLRSTTVARGDR